MKKKISIVTPCFNEEDSVLECYKRLRDVMENQLSEYDYEHIFSDNASTDSTVDKLRLLANESKRVKVIVNSRNVGPFRNMWNAMKYASGDAVIPLLPADLQDPPEIIPHFVKNWESGDLIVYGVRANREESIFMKIARGLYYRIIQRFADSVIPRNSGEFLLADRRVIRSILEVDDSYPYIRGLIAQTGVRSSSISYTWVKRLHGKSRNSMVDLIDQAINGFVSTSRIPARIILIFGFLLSTVGIFFGAMTLISTMINRNGIPVGIPTVVVAIFFFGGIQLFFLGLIGEYILSIHGQVRRSPKMFELEMLNLDIKNLERNIQ